MGLALQMGENTEAKSPAMLAGTTQLSGPGRALFAAWLLPAITGSDGIGLWLLSGGVLAAGESQQQAVNTGLLQSVSSFSLPNEWREHLIEKSATNMSLAGFFPFFSQPLDLRQELAVRERQQEVTRKSAPSSPTLDCEKMDSAVQASLSLPATPVGKGSENSFPSPKGIIHRSCV